MRYRCVSLNTMRDYTGSETVSIINKPATEYTRRTVTVDFLYLDNESCERCMGTEGALEEAIDKLEPILSSLDVGLTVRDIHVSTLEGAKATQLAVSPTIRINGQDIQPDYIQNTCESCGDLCACEGDVDCRLWRYRGEEHTTAPVGLIVNALLQAAIPNQTRLDDADTDSAYQITPNVEDFFTSPKEEQQETDAAECGCSC